ncbi:uncharacterized protein [Procambarus clarkii]|uniref:uncharacterized protein isoform X2 n=1 Tax=Procambarus clarkii TaxID=6728 RepID=UPI00374411AB
MYSKVVWTPNLVRQVKRAFRIVRRDEDGHNCVRRGKRPPLLLTLCSTIDLCTPNTSNCRRTGWRGQQTPIAPTLSAHNLLNFPAPSQLNNCRRTGWRGRQTPIAPTLSAHNLLNFPAPSQLNNCRRTGWRGRQTPIAPTLSAHNLLNFPAPSQLKLWDRCS